MLRFVLLIAIIIGIGWFAHDRRQEAPKAGEKVAYAEARMVFKIPGRDVEGVLVVERPKSRPCNETRMLADVDKVCAQGNICKRSKVECKDSVDSKYMKMLEQKPTHTHYAHMTHNDDQLHGVALLWGLTADESAQFCKMVTDRFNNDRKVDASAKCI